MAKIKSVVKNLNGFSIWMYPKDMPWEKEIVTEADIDTYDVQPDTVFELPPDSSVTIGSDSTMKGQKTFIVTYSTRGGGVQPGGNPIPEHVVITEVPNPQTYELMPIFQDRLSDFLKQHNLLEEFQREFEQSILRQFQQDDIVNQKGELFGTLLGIKNRQQ